MNKSLEKTIVVIAAIIVALILFSTNTPLGKEAANQREALVSAITTPQQVANSMVAFYIAIPLVIAYLLYMKAGGPVYTIKDLWSNIGTKIGFAAGLSSVFVIGTQYYFFLSNVVIMSAIGYYFGKKTKFNIFHAMLISFIPGYYYLLVKVMSTTDLQLITFFNIISVTLFVWIIPIGVAILVYSMYKGYIPKLHKQAAE